MSNFWRDKRVFVTGHTGFKGSWLTLWLHLMGAKVSGYSLPAPTNPSLFHLARLQGCAQTTTGDVRDPKHVADTMAAVQPDIVFHLAAQPLVRDSYLTPVDTYATNVMGTAHVLEAVRNTPSVRSVVVVTSDKCYENREWLWGYREDDPMGGHDPYSSSKGAAELVTSAYRRSFFAKNPDNPVGVASVRAGNVIGGGDFAADRLIPDFIRALERDEPVSIRNPHAVRPWQFVLEPLSGYLQIGQLLFEHGGKYAEGWNFGPADTDLQTVSQLCATFNHSLQKNDVEPVEVRLEPQANAPHEAAFLRLDISKVRQRLDWIPKMELYTALELTAQWYAGYLNNEDLRTLSENQIAFYQSLT
ncbi:CDP-glucose 4,6-dehydratase [Herbaspirillum sp. WKF16]|uniref:CDP-glucose 4,6-dehydratase n=1 Tax=Herbaspirillum sp. WKF16 TaxID=3028312 RepID=UPI0023A9BF35|nr:CDP-glucose 4,6-dehydratase [Herbaspirillum sp. WKF16]WDZ95736.1 CDP-glucose 4,6-dehydratase [Herbaspirillum sp. WKF16]